MPPIITPAHGSLPPEEALGGGPPADGAPPPELAPDPASTLETTPDPAPLPQGPVFAGGRRFNSQAELDHFLARQEGEIEAMRRMQINPPAAAPAAAAPAPARDLGEEIWTNPKGVLEEVVNRAVAISTQTTSAEKAREKAWNDFYTQNQDLVQFRDLTQTIADQMIAKGELTNLPLAESMVRIASKAREYLGITRQIQNPVKETSLPPGPARTAGASGEQPRAPAPAPSKPKTFSEQVAELQARRKRAG